MKSRRHAEVNLQPFVTSTLDARDFPAARSTRIILKYYIKERLNQHRYLDQKMDNTKNGQGRTGSRKNK
jgi:hypothetical protein